MLRFLCCVLEHCLSTFIVGLTSLYLGGQVSGRPIKFVGEGESMTALEPFYPDRMASRILGMGDILSLVEKAEEAVKEQC